LPFIIMPGPPVIASPPVIAGPPDGEVEAAGATLWGNFIITAASGPPRIVATDKETGKVVWESSFADTPEVVLTSAPLAIKDKIIVGAAGGDTGVRDWMAGLDAATGKRLWQKYTIPAPGEPGSETWKDKNNAWRTGGGAVWVTGTYDSDTNQTIWGTGNPVPMFDPTYRPGDNLFTNSAISWDPDSGKMNWYFQFTPGDMWDYDEVGTHIMIDGVVEGQLRKLLTHSARNGFFYTMERANGSITWTTSTGPRASTKRPASRLTMIPIRTSRPIRRSPIRTRARRPRRCVRRSPAATIIGRPRTVR
jgi:alcohol dehydrogenase (cytochrome c)